MASTTLPSLLRASLSGLEHDYVTEGAGRDGLPSLDGWANLLRVLDAGGVRRRELPTLLRLSKRAVSSRVSAAARRGWIDEPASDGANALIRLTGRGADVVAQWKPVARAGEARWREQVGSDRATAVLTALGTVVATFPLEHPHYPASYGTVDASITGGPGEDWKPVPRQGNNTVAGLSMCALISQALVAFSIDYERLSPVPLSVTASILRRVPRAGAPLRDIGASAHLSTMSRHGFVYVDGDGDRATVYLTAKGHAVSSAFEGRVEAVEHAWRQRFGAEAVSNLRQALEDLEHPLAR
jgi:hypothetical protein